VKVASTDL